MAVPKRKTSPSRRNMRRKQNSKVALVQVVENSSTGELQRPHHITKTGYYNGKMVLIQKNKEQGSEVQTATAE